MTYPPPPSGYPGPEPYPGSGPPSPYWQESPQRKGLAIGALVCGILAVLSFCTVVGGVVFGLLAAVLGVVAAVKARRGTAGGGVMAVIAVILGVVSVVAAVVCGLIFWNFYEESGGKDFTECVSRAGNDQQQIVRCEDEFNQRLEEQFGMTVEPPPPTN